MNSLSSEILQLGNLLSTTKANNVIRPEFVDANVAKDSESIRVSNRAWLSNADLLLSNNHDGFSNYLPVPPDTDVTQIYSSEIPLPPPPSSPSKNENSAGFTDALSDQPLTIVPDDSSSHGIFHLTASPSEVTTIRLVASGTTESTSHRNGTQNHNTDVPAIVGVEIRNADNSDNKLTIENPDISPSSDSQSPSSGDCSPTTHAFRQHMLRSSKATSDDPLSLYTTMQATLEELKAEIRDREAFRLRGMLTSTPAGLAILEAAEKALAFATLGVSDTGNI